MKINENADPPPGRRVGATVMGPTGEVAGHVVSDSLALALWEGHVKMLEAGIEARNKLMPAELHLAPPHPQELRSQQVGFLSALRLFGETLLQAPDASLRPLAARAKTDAISLAAFVNDECQPCECERCKARKAAFGSETGPTP